VLLLLQLLQLLL
jgi:hypothetical protein